MELWLGAVLVAAISLLYVAHLLGQRSQKKIANTVREFPNFIVSKQFFSMGVFIAFDMQSRVIVYVGSVFAKPILINAEDIVINGKHEPQLVDINADTTNVSQIYHLTVLAKTGEGREFIIPFRSREAAVKCLMVFHEITEEKKPRNNKAENTAFFIRALKIRIAENGQERAYLATGECQQYIDYLLTNIKKIVFREHAHGDNNLIVKAMFESFGSENDKWLRGNFTEGSLRKYVSERKTELRI